MIKIVLFGKQGCGKTQLFNRLIEGTFADKDKSTNNIEISINNGLEIWKIPYGYQTGLAAKRAYKETQIGVYCLDLHAPAPATYVEINEAIDNFKQIAGGHVPIIIAFTENDLVTEVKANEFVEKLSKYEHVKLSAKDNTGIDSLKSKLMNLAREINENLIVTKLTNLQDCELSEESIEKINQEFKHFVSRLSIKDESAYNDFINNCKTHLLLDDPWLTYIIMALMVCLAIILIMLLSGFTMGMAAGAWTGFAAFIAGIEAGSTLAINVLTGSVILGIIGGFTISYKFFREQKTALQVIEETASEVNQENLLTIQS